MNGVIGVSNGASARMLLQPLCTKDVSENYDRNSLIWVTFRLQARFSRGSIWTISSCFLTVLADNTARAQILDRTPYRNCQQLDRLCNCIANITAWLYSSKPVMHRHIRVQHRSWLKSQLHTQIEIRRSDRMLIRPRASPAEPVMQHRTAAGTATAVAPDNFLDVALNAIGKMRTLCNIRGPHALKQKRSTEKRSTLCNCRTNAI
jgi:hypothetical protein